MPRICYTEWRVKEVATVLRVAICDDEALHREKVERLVKSYAQKAGVEPELLLYDSGKRLLGAREAFDILFLDIDMPGVDGITVAREVRRQNEGAFIVFVTSFMEYALQGYEVKAFRYILKSSLAETLPYCLDDILKELRSRERQLFLRFVEGEQQVLADDILYIESQRHKLVFHLRGGRELGLYRRLDELEEELRDLRFLRIHKSFLVNANHVRRIKNYEAVLTDGTALPVPKQRYTEVKQRFVLLKGAS